MAAKKESGASFSVKMKSAAAKAEVSSCLKVYADAKGMTQGDALLHIIDTVRSYGELPAITANALNEFTAAVEGRLNSHDLKLAAILEELSVISHVLQIAASDVGEEPEFESANDDYEENGSAPVMDVLHHSRVKRGR